MRRARGGRVGRPAACADASGDTWRRGASRASFAVRLWSTPDLDVRPAIRRAAHAQGLEGRRTFGADRGASAMMRSIRRLVLALQFLTCLPLPQVRSEEHKSELPSLMPTSYSDIY